MVNKKKNTVQQCERCVQSINNSAQTQKSLKLERERKAMPVARATLHRHRPRSGSELEHSNG